MSTTFRAWCGSGSSKGHGKGLLDLGKGQDVADDRSDVDAALDDPVEGRPVVALGIGADRENQAQFLAQQIQHPDRHQALDVVLVRDAKADHLRVAVAEIRYKTESLRNAHGLDCETGHGTAGDFGDRSDWVLGCRTNRMRGPHLAAHLQAVGQRIDRHDAARTEVAQHRVKQQPHRSLTDHYHIAVNDVAQLVEAVDHRAQELAHQHLFLGQVAGQADAAAVVLGQDVLLEKPAVKAPQQHPFPLPIAPRRAGFDQAHAFVSSGPGRLWIALVGAAKRRLVAAADRDPFHFHQHLVADWLGFVRLDDFPLTRGD